MPMIGFTPYFFALDQKSYAPCRLPWSVIAIDDIPRSLTRENNPSSKEAPSSIEYSVCTCRWAKLSWVPVDMERGSHLPEGVASLTGTRWRASGKSASLRQSGSHHRHPVRVAPEPVPDPVQTPPRAICWRRSIRSSVGGCVENSFETSWARNGL